LLAALYLGWMGQALYAQQGFAYVHVPETFLALAVLTAQRWRLRFAPLACAGGAAVAWQLAALCLPAYFQPLRPLVSADRLALWPRCWYEWNSPALRDRLAYLGGTHPSSNSSELEEVAEYLRQQGVGDGELVCWHDSTHPLYLMLGVKPGIRFMHVGTVLLMGEHYDDVRQNLIDARKKKFAVSDLLRVLRSVERVSELDLPARLSEQQRHVFPFDQPIVFRSSAGRYLVHRIEKPIDRIDVPAPAERE
jgi:hypothetical protein